MPDLEWSQKILDWFYDNRARGITDVLSSQVDANLPPEEFSRVCRNLEGRGFTQVDRSRLPLPVIGIVSAAITAIGAEYVERVRSTASPSPLRINSYCYQCGGDREHEVLCSDKEQTDYEYESNSFVTFGSEALLLKCCGCKFVSLRKGAWSSEATDDCGRPEISFEYFPAPCSKPMPTWLVNLLEQGDTSFKFQCLADVYAAFSSGHTWLACVGARSVLEHVMIEQAAGDQGSFARNLSAFQAAGHINPGEKHRFETVLEAGHAATHRGFRPKQDEVSLVLDLLSNVLERVYFDEKTLIVLQPRIPPRPNIRRSGNQP